jgi:hypothetical protein
MFLRRKNHEFKMEVHCSRYCPDIFDNSCRNVEHKSKVSMMILMMIDV